MIQDLKQTAKKKTDRQNFLEILKNSARGSENPLDKEWYLRRLFSERVKRTEKELFNGRKRELEKEARILLEETKKELKELKKANTRLSSQVEKAVFSPPPKATPHFLSFLLHLWETIRQTRKMVENSTVWLSAQNERGGKKGPFWATFLNKKRGGSQFLLSSEHYLTRSAG